jgi:ABC-2 type transport system ATP-binding protein
MEGPGPAIEVQGLSRRFYLASALVKVDFAVGRGEVCGLIGSNGAGKTTLLRILATLLLPTSGLARVAGFDVRNEAPQVRKRIGYMPDTFGAFDDMRADSYLEFFARIYRLPADETLRVLEDILRLVDLVHLRNTPVSRLSLGARQRLSLGRVLVHNPEVLLLDEPVSGLDPVARVEMRELLRELGRMGKTVLVSSHALADLAELVTRVVVREKGETALAGTLEDLKRMVMPERVLELEVEGDVEKATQLLSAQIGLSGVRAEEGGRLLVSLRDGDLSPSAVSRILFGAGFGLRRLLERELDLEEAFLRITRRDRP